MAKYKPLNKAQHAALLEEIEALKISAALRPTAPVAPDVPPPAVSTEKLSVGFTFNPYFGSGHSPSVSEACSSSNNHNKNDNRRVATQGAISLYSSELRAWRACRYVVEQRCAEILYGIDQKIKQLEENP